MKAKKISVAGVAQRTKREEKKAITGRVSSLSPVTEDSFQNIPQGLGIGADNAMSTSQYGFNPITRVRTMLEWMHRGSWLAGVAVDVVADDMTKAGVEIQGKLAPRAMEKIMEAETTLGIWNSLNANLKWGRLYGGSIAVMVIEGQQFHTPLRVETVGKGQFKGLIVFDRWMCEPSLNDLVDTGLASEMGMPKYYTIAADGPALRNQKIHHSRVIRAGGIQVPYWQRVMENLWDISVLERLYDRMVAFDSATTGAAQLVYKSYIRTYKVKNLREVLSVGGNAGISSINKYVDMMRRFQGIEGITIIDADDEFEGMQHQAFSGLGDALTQFGQQLSGALQIPLVRLFGQSPSGFNSGDTDLRMYYDSINQQQNKMLKVGITRIYRMIAQSEGIKLPEGVSIEFRSLWQLTDDQKADVATKVTAAIVQAEEAGLVSPQVGMKELQQSSHVTGIFSNISEKDINAADDVAVPAAEQAMELGAELMPEGGDDDDEGGGKGAGGGKGPKLPAKPKKPGGTKDSGTVDEQPGGGQHTINVSVGGPTIHHTPPGVNMPDINIQPADIHVAPAAVNVAPPNVTVEGATVNMPPANITVNVPKQAPAVVNLGDTNVTVPEQKAPNVKVEIGETKIDAHFTKAGDNVTKEVTSTKNPDGSITTVVKPKK